MLTKVLASFAFECTIFNSITPASIIFNLTKAVKQALLKTDVNLPLTVEVEWVHIYLELTLSQDVNVQTSSCSEKTQGKFVQSSRLYTEQSGGSRSVKITNIYCYEPKQCEDQKASFELGNDFKIIDDTHDSR